ncbi:MAG: zinc ribbon domain-containing protein [Candidatus Sumerlaeota bacterium]|nr:zinc ribbon domain-containing protein [Candidatus Sumerlaeota bacterium]
MPVYEYAHREAGACSKGPSFECFQSMKDEALKTCPECGQPVYRVIGAPGIATPKTNTELKNLGFTKLVRRDSGVYENVTATSGESRYMEAGKPETLPHLRKKIED